MCGKIPAEIPAPLGRLGALGRAPHESKLEKLRPHGKVQCMCNDAARHWQYVLQHWQSIQYLGRGDRTPYGRSDNFLRPFQAGVVSVYYLSQKEMLIAEDTKHSIFGRIFAAKIRIDLRWGPPLRVGGLSSAMRQDFDPWYTHVRGSLCP